VTWPFVSRRHHDEVVQMWRLLWEAQTAELARVWELVRNPEAPHVSSSGTAAPPVHPVLPDAVERAITQIAEGDREMRRALEQYARAALTDEEAEIGDVAAAILRGSDLPGI
jgi:hypothetical protein